MMSDECVAACPSMKGFLEAMMEAKEGESTTLMCDHLEAVECMHKEKVCEVEGEDKGTEEEQQIGLDAFKCGCSCASEMEMLEDSKKMCASKDKVVTCLTANSVCAPIVKMLGGTRSADITCEMLDKKCEELGEKLGTCVGVQDWTTFGGDCSAAAVAGKLADHKDKCCPLLTKVMGCYNKDCVTLGWEQQEIMLANMKAGSEKTEEAKSVAGNYQWGLVCTDSGLPDSKDALMGRGKATADDASQAVPVLGMAAMLVAASF